MGKKGRKFVTVRASSVAQRYSKAIFGGDWETLGQLRHDEYVCRWPQSGEVVRGHDKWVEITERYPQSGGDFETVSGGEPLTLTQVKTPLPFGPPIYAMTGGGDSFTLQGQIRYPDGTLYHIVSICEIENGQVIRECTYFAEPFEPPDWRSDLVEIEN